MGVLDCSHYQGQINWSAVKSDITVGAVIVKVTDGPAGVDANWRANHDGARAVGLPVAPYHFSEDSNATAEANHFASFWSAGWDFRPWLDEEKSSANAAFVTAFRSEFRSSTGYPLFGVYSSESLLNGQLNPGAWIDAQTGIWAARYAGSLGWDHAQLLLWQYTSGGSVRGINGFVDLSRTMHGWTPSLDRSGGTPMTAPTPNDIWSAEVWAQLPAGSPEAAFATSVLGVTANTDGSVTIKGNSAGAWLSMIGVRVAMLQHNQGAAGGKLTGTADVTVTLS